MLEKLRELVVRPAVTRWLATSASSWTTGARPDAQEVLTSDGPDPDRILVLGGGVATGWGQSSHEHAFSGFLTRRIAELTGRGVFTQVVVDDVLASESALSSPITSALRSVDAIVVTPGDLDSLLMLPPAAYRRRVGSLIDRITALAPASARIFVVGLVPLATVIAMPHLAACATRKLGRDLDIQARRAIQSRPNATFVPLSPHQMLPTATQIERNAAWAALAAPVMTTQLDSHGEHSIL